MDNNVHEPCETADMCPSCRRPDGDCECDGNLCWECGYPAWACQCEIGGEG